MIKPILFNTDMVRALLANRKTATRRVVKPHYRDGEAGFRVVTNAHTGKYVRIECFDEWEDETRWMHDPYRPGDILYVRETWQEVYETEFDANAPGSCVDIRSLIPNFDSIPKVEAGISTNCSCSAMAPRMKYYVFKASDIEYADPTNGLIWRPSIHMPREAARIFLRVTDVRAERLQDITEEQAEAEGVDNYPFTARGAFFDLWNSTIKPTDRAIYGWAANPWVWVIEFERISREEALLWAT